MLVLRDGARPRTTPPQPPSPDPWPAVTAPDRRRWEGARRARHLHGSTSSSVPPPGGVAPGHGPTFVVCSPWQEHGGESHPRPGLLPDGPSDRVAWADVPRPFRGTSRLTRGPR